MRQLPFGRETKERCSFREFAPLLEKSSVNAASLPDDVKARLGTFMEMLDLSYERFQSKMLFRESGIPGIMLYDFEKGCPKLSMIAGLRILEELAKSGDSEVLKAVDVAHRLAFDLAMEFGVFSLEYPCLLTGQRDFEIISRMDRIEHRIIEKIGKTTG